MPIFEERESLGVKTLKSFADIKKELEMFSIVKYGRSSLLMNLKVIFHKDSYKFVVYHGYLNEKVGLVQLSLLQISS